MTSPAPDVWPSILTDYTYDSELDNADGVPHSVSMQRLVPGGEHCFFILYSELNSYFFCPSVGLF